MTTFALALASNFNAYAHLTWAIEQLEYLGHLEVSPVFEIPCRDGVGADYLNMACLLNTSKSLQQVQYCLKQLEQQTGRVRPSHQISLDIDLIAWQEDEKWYMNKKKMPFALDVKVPMSRLVALPIFQVQQNHGYKTIELC